MGNDPVVYKSETQEMFLQKSFNTQEHSAGISLLNKGDVSTRNTSLSKKGIDDWKTNYDLTFNSPKAPVTKPKGLKDLKDDLTKNHFKFSTQNYKAPQFPTETQYQFQNRGNPNRIVSLKETNRMKYSSFKLSEDQTQNLHTSNMLN